MDKFIKKSRLFLLVLLALFLISALSIKIVWGWTAPNGNPPTGSNNNAIFYYNGKIGVGTSTPAYPLSASGTIYSSVGFRFPDGTTQTTAFSGISQTITSGNVSAGYFGSNTGGGNYSFPASLSIGTSTAPTGGVAFFNGNVGIGTASPARKLDVSTAGQITFGDNVADDDTSGIYWHSSSNYGIYRTAGAWTANTYQQLKIQFSTGIQLGAGTGVGTGYDKSYVEVVSGKGLMVTSGNVGIATTTPAYPLTVAGTIFSSTGGFRFPDGTTQTSAAGTGSQWTTSSTAIYYNTGNVGIGTTNPGTYGKLEIKQTADTNIGGISIGNSAYARIMRLWIDASNNSYVESGSGGVGNLILNSGTGKVGIATTTPAYPLTVAGTIYSSTGGVRFPDGTTQTTAFLGGSSQTITAANVSSGNFGANTGGGNYSFPANIGIATTTATYPLSVEGNGYFSGILGIGSIPNTNRNINSYISAANASKTGIYSSSDVSGVLSANRTNYGLYSLITNTADNTTNTNTLYGNYSQITNSDGAGYDTAYGSFNYILNSDASKVIPTSVGSIGYINNNATGTLTNAQGTLGQIVNNSTGAITNATGAYGYIRNDEGTMTNAYSVRGNVIQNIAGGVISSAYGGYFAVTQTAGTINTGYGVYITDVGGTAQYGLYQAGSTDTNYFAGDVGVGLTDPDAKFTIANISSSTDQIRLRSTRTAITADGIIGGMDFMSNDTNLTAPGSVVGSIQAIANQAHTASALGTDLVFSGTTGTTMSELMRIKGSGNVGIGTTGPVTRLQIGDGTVNTGNIIRFGKYESSTENYLPIIQHKSQIVAGTSNDLALAAQSTNGGIIFYTGGVATENVLGGGLSAIRMAIKSDGNVGIGTASPTYNLDISGTFRASATSTFNGNVGIGTTNPLSKLSVGGNGVANAGVYGTGITYGVYGSGGNYGVYGSGVNSGVYGSGDTYGVRGEGVLYGVRGYGDTFDFYAAGPGTNYGPFTGGHEVKLSDNFPKNFKNGLIVSVTGETKIRKDKNGKISLSSTLPTVRLSDKSEDKTVFGVLVAENLLPNDYWYNTKNGERFATVNALGEGRVWVSDINGEIQAGDYITSSNIPGYGQKQNDNLLHNYTLGKITENIDWNNISETVEYNGQTYKIYLIGVVYVSG